MRLTSNNTKGVRVASLALSKRHNPEKVVLIYELLLHRKSSIDHRPQAR